eukprot:1949198-Pyramimonas_sp.AAC.1
MARDAGATRNMPTVQPWNVTSAIARNISVVNAPAAMGDAGSPSMNAFGSNRFGHAECPLGHA